MLKTKIKTLFGGFPVDERGFHKADGKQVVVWPDEAAAGKLSFPAPPWRQR